MLRIGFNKLINSLVILFCFLIFPSFLIYYSLDFIFETNRNKLKQNVLIKMNNRLEYLNKYSNNKRYFHFLLTKISQYAQSVEDPIKYIELNINNLKKKYPDKFQFVVWDADGKIINRLSDKLNYNYVLKKLFNSLKEVAAKIAEDYSFRISELDCIKNNNRIFHSFFGKIFISENLKIPLSRSFDAGPFLTELGHGLTYVWFSINNRVSLMCFISDELLSEYSGLDIISEKLNTNDDLLITGYSINNNYNKPVTFFPEKYYPDLQMALSTFENAGDSIFENNNALVKMSMPESSIRTFCFLPKNDSTWNYEINRNIWFLVILSILIMLYVLWGIYFYYRRYFFSIRWKLTALFLFANLAPIAVIGFIAKDYLDSQRLSIKNEIVGDLEKAVRELEARYKSMIDDYNLRLNFTVTEVSKKTGNNVIKQDEIDTLKSLYDEYNAFELYIIASSSRMVDYKRDESKAKQRLKYMATWGREVLAYSNKDFEKNEPKSKKSNMSRFQNSEFLDAFIKNNGYISDFNIGGMARIYYSYCFGDKSKHNNNYLFIMFWDRDYLQNLFLRETYKTMYKIVPDAHFFIKSNISRKTYGDKQLEKIINSILERNSGIVKKISGDSLLYNKKYIYVCVNGNVLKDWILVAAYPEDRINNTIYLIVIQIIGGVFLSILLTFIIIRILSLHFLNPIHYLGEAALAINDRNFSYRIPVVDQDEFGHLGQVFNHVIEGLADFEVAKIVQESLFPANNLLLENFNIFGKSIVATTLGGDYYDYFKINDKFIGIIIANVSVKGIPAGLIMAMAKSVVLSSSEDIKLNPSKLTSRLNKMFLSIKGKSLNQVMSFQYFVLSAENGHFIFTNAGHCLPVIVDANSNITDYINFSAPRLGESIDYEYSNYEFDLLGQQSLILYTDAVIKAFNKSNDKLNNDAFNNSLKQNYDLDPEKYYNNLYDIVYKSSSQKVYDITLVVINKK